MDGMGYIIYIYVIQFGFLSIYLLKGSQPKRELPGLKGFQMVTESLVSLFLGHASCFPPVVLLKRNRWCKLCKKTLVTSQTNQTRHRIAIVHKVSQYTCAWIRSWGYMFETATTFLDKSTRKDIKTPKPAFRMQGSTIKDTCFLLGPMSPIVIANFQFGIQTPPRIREFFWLNRGDCCSSSKG